MIGHFYTEYAEYYAVIANDRNFSKECRKIISFLNLNEEFNMLEIFAGPAYHSIELTKQGINTWAIDLSKEMKSIAVVRGFRNPGHYLSGKLPNELDNLKKQMDCVLCMRYSIGYLNRKEVFVLLNKMKTILKYKGLIFIELHRINDLLSNYDNAAIKKRTSKMPGGEEIECTWPHGKIKWASTDFVAKMDVAVKINGSDKMSINKMFKSVEYIYSFDELNFMASLLGYKCIKFNDSENIFNNSQILILEYNGKDNE